MTQAARKMTFEEYLNLDDFDDLPEERCEFVDGELVALPPESEPNDWIARYLFLLLANAGIVSARLIAIHTCEFLVPVLQPTAPRNRYPDLVILREEHLQLTQRRLTIKLDMPPPQLVAEVVSPTQSNHDRDYSRQVSSVPTTRHPGILAHRPRTASHYGAETDRGEVHRGGYVSRGCSN